jgi:hypothetical protein
MAMATSPSRLDPPRVAILPTATPGNNNSVPIAKMHIMCNDFELPALDYFTLLREATQIPRCNTVTWKT